MKKLLLLTLTISCLATAGTPDEDPIARNYQDQFQAALTPSFDQIHKRKPSTSTEQSPKGLWRYCHSRNLAQRNFESFTSHYDFSKINNDILSTYYMSSNQGREFTLNHGELQSIHNVKLIADADPKKTVESIEYQTIRADKEGNLIIEVTYVPVDGARLSPLTVAPVASTYTPSKVSHYTVCKVANLL